VRTHARNIYRKLGISSRRDLARLSRPDGGASSQRTAVVPSPPTDGPGARV
jgi:hypothetical protein